MVPDDLGTTETAKAMSLRKHAATELPGFRLLTTPAVAG